LLTAVASIPPNVAALHMGISAVQRQLCGSSVNVQYAML
jgi:hypothetical protein